MAVTHRDLVWILGPGPLSFADAHPLRPPLPKRPMTGFHDFCLPMATPREDIEAIVNGLNAAWVAAFNSIPVMGLGVNGVSRFPRSAAKA